MRWQGAESKGSLKKYQLLCSLERHIDEVAKHKTTCDDPLRER